MPEIDRERLLAWLEGHADPAAPLIRGAVLTGVAERIRRGDFDREDDR